MVLKELIDKLMDTGGLVVLVDDNGNVECAYDDREHFNEYQSCEVESIYLTGYEKMETAKEKKNEKQNS